MQLLPQAFPFLQTLQQPATTALKVEFAGADIAAPAVDVRHSKPVAITSFHVVTI